MKLLAGNRILYFVGASALTMFLLILIQVKWLNHSKNLIEEQFDNKVSLALCGAVQKFSATSTGKNIAAMCQPIAPNRGCCIEQLGFQLDDPALNKEIAEALSFYDIHLDFQLHLLPSAAPLLFDDKNYKNNSTGCSLMPLQATQDYLQIVFPAKHTYVLNKMGLMIGLSALFIATLIGTLIYGYFAIQHQQNLTHKNKEYFNLMAHEFKTPLTNIGLATNMLRKKSDHPLLKIVQEEHRHLRDEVEKILSMASLENDQLYLQKEKIDLYRLLKETIETMEVQLLDRGGKIHLQAVDQPIFIEADAIHLTNVFKNLIENGLKYNENVPIINISIDRLGSEVHLQIKDNGIGISKEDHQLIFEKYYRIQTEMNESRKGFGLGLTYVKKIIEMHGGVIRILEDWKEGAAFQVSIPVLKA